ncbi:MAG: hypothetical protein JRH20_13315 [Deltaproteobacteria bacterium]|nr:hypothetical protein [Deltaproteobacteria bacterium]
MHNWLMVIVIALSACTRVDNSNHDRQDGGATDLVTSDITSADTQVDLHGHTADMSVDTVGPDIVTVVDRGTDTPTLLGWGQPVEIKVNELNAPLQAGDTLLVEIDHSALVNANKSDFSGADIRILYNEGAGFAPIPFLVTPWSGWYRTCTEIHFQVKAMITGTSQSYMLAYGPRAAAMPQPQADPSTMYPFFDDFDGSGLDLTRWTLPQGSVLISGGQMTVLNGAVLTSTAHLPQDFLLVAKFSRIAASKGTMSLLLAAESNGMIGFGSVDNAVYFGVENGEEDGSFPLPSWPADSYVYSISRVGGMASFWIDDTNLGQIQGASVPSKPLAPYLANASDGYATYDWIVGLKWPPEHTITLSAEESL